MSIGPADSLYHRDLGEGLLLRWSTSADTAALAQLVGTVFREQAEAPLNVLLQNLIGELMSGTYPLMGSGDFALVEDRNQPGNPLVACTCLLRQTWEYEGIPFEIGRPEIVASNPAYRHRGLIRAIFELIHARSESENRLVQAITGIPYFYRLFGYEYALDLGGNCAISTLLIPPASENTPEPFTLRDATLEDIPLLHQLYNRRQSAGIVSARLDEVWWRYQLASWQTSTTGDHWHIQIIIDATGRSQGYLIAQTMRWGSSLQIMDLAFVSGVNVQAILLPLLRSLAAQGQELPTREQPSEPLSRITFELGGSHPLYDVLGTDFGSVQDAPYAWYVRVSDLPGFIRHITPVLEQRLAASVVANYSGELTFDFYRGGLRLVFERGRLTTAQDWQSPLWNAHPDGRFPQLTFLQLVFGYRSLEALQAAFPDVRISGNEKRLLINTLFPARPSWVLG
jgi:hypothetical protein